MIGVLQGDDAAARAVLIAPEAQRHLQRHFHRSGTAVGIEDVRQAGRRVFYQTQREVFGGLVGATGENHLIQSIGLRLDRRHDPGVAMTMGDHSPGRDRIKQSAMPGLEPGALRTIDAWHVRRQRMLGEGMPDRGCHAKSALLKLAAKTDPKRPRTRGTICGRRPNRFTRPFSAMMLSLSSLASPMKA